MTPRPLPPPPPPVIFDAAGLKGGRCRCAKLLVGLFLPLGTFAALSLASELRILRGLRLRRGVYMDTGTPDLPELHERTLDLHEQPELADAPPKVEMLSAGEVHGEGNETDS